MMTLAMSSSPHRPAIGSTIRHLFTTITDIMIIGTAITMRNPEMTNKSFDTFSKVVYQTISGFFASSRQYLDCDLVQLIPLSLSPSPSTSHFDFCTRQGRATFISEALNSPNCSTSHETISTPSA
jgi:hypothetical protein